MYETEAECFRRGEQCKACPTGIEHTGIEHTLQRGA
jgi:hypothetical protein